MKKSIFRANVRVFITMLAFFFIPLFANAADDPDPIYPPIASTPCDTLYYESLSARAWLEAQREITQNQNIILKPDSVLEYTCFDMFLRELAQHASNMLSESDVFGSGTPENSMDNALQDLIMTSLKAYGKANFGQDRASSDALYAYGLLGGHDAGVGLSGHDFSNPLRPRIEGGAYSCSVMQEVWQAAKCINFASNLTVTPDRSGTPTDGFFTFQEYADVTSAANALDRRHLPTMCYGPSDVDGYAKMKAKWSANLIAATITPAWTEDPVKTYIASITPPTCSTSPCLCTTKPIPTGVRVTRTVTEPLSYDDKVCVQPGCRYNPDKGLIDGAKRDEGCYAH